MRCSVGIGSEGSVTEVAKDSEKFGSCQNDVGKHARKRSPAKTYYLNLPT